MLEHKQDANKNVLVIAVLVIGANQGTVTLLMAMKAQVTPQIICSELPIHNRLVVDLEEPMLLDLQ